VAITPASGPAFEIAPHHCFACGTLNEHGLHLDLHLERGRSWVELALDDRFQGWDEIAHGGILSTILDEVMAWALVDHDLWGVTARLNVDFRRPVPIGRRIRGEGRVRETKRRVIYAEGVLVDAEDGTELARAEATFVGAPEARKQELKERYGFRLEAEGTGKDATPTATPATVDRIPTAGATR
jgi:uncharacterized protein (TIGR00369 family)